MNSSIMNSWFIAPPSLIAFDLSLTMFIYIVLYTLNLCIYTLFIVGLVLYNVQTDSYLYIRSHSLSIIHIIIYTLNYLSIALQ